MKSEKFIKKWEKDRQKNKNKYVLTHGFLIGIGSCIGYAIFRLTKNASYDIFTEYFIPVCLTYFFATFTAGVIGALLRWQLNEEKYERLVNKNSHEQ